ncbi:hypothetical protein VTK26DRAFT_7609 [Humicola hyalothermophila]
MMDGWSGMEWMDRLATGGWKLWAYTLLAFTVVVAAERKGDLAVWACFRLSLVFVAPFLSLSPLCFFVARAIYPWDDGLLAGKGFGRREEGVGSTVGIWVCLGDCGRRPDEGIEGFIEQLADLVWVFGWRIGDGMIDDDTTCLPARLPTAYLRYLTRGHEQKKRECYGCWVNIESYRCLRW